MEPVFVDGGRWKMVMFFPSVPPWQICCGDRLSIRDMRAKVDYEKPRIGRRKINFIWSSASLLSSRMPMWWNTNYFGCARSGHSVYFMLTTTIYIYIRTIRQSGAKAAKAAKARQLDKSPSDPRIRRPWLQFLTPDPSTWEGSRRKTIPTNFDFIERLETLFMGQEVKIQNRLWQAIARVFE